MSPVEIVCRERQEKGDTLMDGKKAALSSLVGQAWGQLQGMMLEEVRKKVEELAEAERETRLGRGRHGRGESAWWRWGYKVRKGHLSNILFLGLS